MYQLTDPQTIRDILKRYQTHFKKGFGQNFLLDENVLEDIVEATCVDSDTNVIEIGPGIGTLTSVLAKRAKKVVCIEIDHNLIEVLADTLSDFDHVKIIEADALEVDFNRLISEEFSGGRVVIAANLPYYITTPIVAKMLEEKVEAESFTFMVQEEVAKRFCAAPGGKDYGAITLLIKYYTEARIVTRVPAESFMPPPSVSSAVISLRKRTEPIVMPKNEEKFFGLIRASFNQRRKTFVNGIVNSGKFNVNKEEIVAILAGLGLSADIRGERLSIEDFCHIADQL
jgi:dimethyladenosine transferase